MFSFHNSWMKDYAIHVYNPNGDPNNPKANLLDSDLGNSFPIRIIEHLDGGTQNSAALSHETVLLRADPYYITGDAGGYTFINGPDCGGDPDFGTVTSYPGSPEPSTCNGTHQASTNTGHLGVYWHLSPARLGSVRSPKDIIRGNEANDTLVGLSYADTLYGNGGDDVLYGDDVSSDQAISGFPGQLPYTIATSGTQFGGNDVLYGGAGTDALFGGRGNDSLYGGVNNDFLFGEDGNDSLYGGANNDRLDGGEGDNYLNGQDGSDTIYVGSGSNQIWGSDTVNPSEEGDKDVVDYSQHAPIVVTYSNVTINGVTSITVAKQNGAVDTLNRIDSVVLPSVGGMVIGSAHANIIEGNVGADSIDGKGGNDSITGGGGADLLYGGDGDDYIVCGAGRGEAEGGAGADTLWSTDGQDIASYFNSKTAVAVELTDNVNKDGFIMGSGLGANLESSGDELRGFHRVYGSNFNDEIYGNSQANWLVGGEGNDTIFGNGGQDTIFGAEGDDFLVCGAGTGLAAGGLGADTIGSTNGTAGASYQVSTTAAIVELTDTLSEEGFYLGHGYGENLESTGDLLIGISYIEGSDFNDTFYGNSQDNVLYGRNGNDTLVGNSGVDILYGGAGDDCFLFGNGSGYDYVSELTDGGQKDVANFIGITTVYVFKQWDHLLLATEDGANVMVLDKWYTNGGVEAIFFQDVNVERSVASLAEFAQDITPASTFSGEGSDGQANAILPVGIISADASNVFDATQLSA